MPILSDNSTFLKGAAVTDNSKLAINDIDSKQLHIKKIVDLYTRKFSLGKVVRRIICFYHVLKKAVAITLGIAVCTK